jgi:hypothetical protein
MLIFSNVVHAKWPLVRGVEGFWLLSADTASYCVFCDVSARVENQLQRSPKRSRMGKLNCPGAYREGPHSGCDSTRRYKFDSHSAGWEGRKDLDCRAICISPAQF